MHADFCRTFLLTPYLVTESCLCYFVTCLGDEELAESTIKFYMAGIRHIKISLGLEDPRIYSSHAPSGLSHKGIKSLRGRTSNSQGNVGRLPITLGILWKIEGILSRRKPDHNNLLLWEMCWYHSLLCILPLKGNNSTLEQAFDQSISLCM